MSGIHGVTWSLTGSSDGAVSWGPWFFSMWASTCGYLDCLRAQWLSSKKNCSKNKHSKREHTEAARSIKVQSQNWHNIAISIFYQSKLSSDRPGLWATLHKGIYGVIKMTICYKFQNNYYVAISIKLNIEIPHDPASPLLSI